MSEELDRAIKTARDGRAQVERLGITPKGYEEKDRYIMLDEIDSLRASNAALKAENEALKASEKAWSINAQGNLTESRNAEAKLSLYTSWTPQDPGTKEAMEWARSLEGDPCWWVTHSTNLAHALRAAMVRLEEAEKMINQGAKDGRHYGQACLKGHDLTGCGCGRCLDAAESQVSALTASLASMERQRDEYREAWNHMRADSNLFADQRDAANASLASVTKERDELLAWKCRAESSCDSQGRGI